MIGEHSTLEDVCFEVSAALESCGIECVLTGGSAAAVYSSGAYASLDADFVLADKASREESTKALAALGFRPSKAAGIFEHPKSRFTIDFPKGPLAVGGDYIRETATLERNNMRLRILTPFDSVRDRLAHFYFWNDFTALRAAVGVAQTNRQKIDFQNIRTWTQRESAAAGVDYISKFDEFLKRVGSKP